MTQQPPTSRALTVKEKHNQAMTLVRQREQSLTSLLPPDLPPARFMQIISDALIRNPALLECYPPSIVHCALASAELGLELASPLGHAYMVPFYNSKRGRKEAVFIPGYKGLVKLMLESPKLVAVRAAVVYEGEAYEYEEGLQPKIFHQPTGEKRGIASAVAAYAVAHYVGGLAVPSWMWRWELDKLNTEGQKKGGEFSVWRSNPDEMMRKSPIRRLAKTCDLSTKLARALEHEDAADRAFDRGAGDGPDSKGEALKDRIRKGHEVPEAEIVDVDTDDDVPG